MSEFNLRPTCNAVQLIARLQEMVDKHGNLPVYVEDSDSSYNLPLGLTYEPAKEADTHGGQGACPNLFHITTNWYSGAPEGFIVPEDKNVV